jgi:hypothetical protein
MEGEDDNVVVGNDGEPMSKNAQKKLLKAKEAEAKKKEKADAKAILKETAGPSKGKLGGDDEEVDPTKYFENRTNALAVFEVSCIFEVYKNFMFTRT